MEGSVSVDTISELSALVPTLGAIVRVLGYREAFDCPIRYYRWSTEATALAKDFGVRISSTHTGLGSWFLLPQGLGDGIIYLGVILEWWDMILISSIGAVRFSANGKRLVIGRQVWNKRKVIFNCDVLIQRRSGFLVVANDCFRFSQRVGDKQPC